MRCNLLRVIMITLCAVGMVIGKGGLTIQMLQRQVRSLYLPRTQRGIWFTKNSKTKVLNLPAAC